MAHMSALGYLLVEDEDAALRRCLNTISRMRQGFAVEQAFERAMARTH